MRVVPPLNFTDPDTVVAQLPSARLAVDLGNHFEAQNEPETEVQGFRVKTTHRDGTLVLHMPEVSTGFEANVHARMSEHHSSFCAANNLEIEATA
jgi:hypothetical protein